MNHLKIAVTRLKTGHWFRSWQIQEFCPFSKAFRPALGPPSLIFYEYWWGESSVEVRQPSAWSSPLPSIKG